VEVSVWTYGNVIKDHTNNTYIDTDLKPSTQTYTTTTPVNGADNPHNPIWYKPSQEPFKFEVEEEEIDMVVFRVLDSTVKNKIIGYYAITVGDIREGLRVVPLKGEYGLPLVSGDLLVEVYKQRI